jgi:hypothetical protein
MHPRKYAAQQGGVISQLTGCQLPSKPRGSVQRWGVPGSQHSQPVQEIWVELQGHPLRA